MSANNSAIKMPSRAGRAAIQIMLPVASILLLWYGTIWLSGLPTFVIPRPEQVLATLVTDAGYIWHHLMITLSAAVLGFIVANLVGVGFAILFSASPIARLSLMPAAITIRNIPYIALVTILVLAIGDTIASKIIIVALAGFFPVLVNTMRGLKAVDQVILDRMHVLNASPVDVFRRVRLPFAMPYFISAQEITGSGSIIVTIVAEWMMSSSGLGFVLNRAMAQYRGDQVYAVALIAALLSYLIYALVNLAGRKLDWSGSS